MIRSLENYRSERLEKYWENKINKYWEVVEVKKRIKVTLARAIGKIVLDDEAFTERSNPLKEHAGEAGLEGNNELSFQHVECVYPGRTIQY